MDDIEILRIFAPKIEKDMTELVVSVEDVSLLTDIKRAIKMLRGVAGVTLPKQKKSRLERAIDDVRSGRFQIEEHQRTLFNHIQHFYPPNGRFPVSADRRTRHRAE